MIRIGTNVASDAPVGRTNTFVLAIDGDLLGLSLLLLRRCGSS